MAYSGLGLSAPYQQILPDGGMNDRCVGATGSRCALPTPTPIPPYMGGTLRPAPTVIPGPATILPNVEVTRPGGMVNVPQVKITTVTTPTLTAPGTVPFPKPFGIPWPVILGLAALAFYLARKR